MDITITAIRIKKQNEIQEIFKWYPHSRFYYDAERGLSIKIRTKIAQMSLHNKTKIKLVDIKYFMDSIVYSYNIIEDLSDIQNIEESKIQYFPILGKKVCKNCRHFKIWKNKNICLLRKDPITKQIGCWDWQEKEKKDVYK